MFARRTQSFYLCNILIKGMQLYQCWQATDSQRKEKKIQREQTGDAYPFTERWGHYVTLVVGHFLSKQKFLNKDKRQATLLVAVFPI
jgi:hypothetical protein